VQVLFQVKALLTVVQVEVQQAAHMLAATVTQVVQIPVAAVAVVPEAAVTEAQAAQVL
tara:strand:- start:69 stop:242 length:174 start_codon:yes stop_codon:yes gene_type:complete